MRSEQEIKQHKEELVTLINFLGEHGSPDHNGEKTLLSMSYALTALAWVLEEAPTNEFRRFVQLDLEGVGGVVSNIEKITGERLTNHE